MSNLPRYTDPIEFERIFAKLTEESPGNPHNRLAAEKLAQPPERRGWSAIYITWQKEWRRPDE
jgi:hypothetical protein